MVWEQKETSGDAQALWVCSLLEHIPGPGGVKMDGSIHVLCVERCSSAGTSPLSFVCSSFLALPVQGHVLLFLRSTLKPRDGHFSTEEKTLVLNTFKLNWSFKGISWDKEKHINSFRGFCDKQWEDKTSQSFEDKSAALGKWMGLYLRFIWQYRELLSFLM